MRIQELSNLTHSRSSFNKQLSFNWNTSKIPEKDLLEVYSQTFSKLRAELKTLKESGYDVSGFKSQLDSLYATYEKFAALQPVDLGKKLGLEHVKGYTGPSSAATDTQWAAMKHQAEVQEVAGEAAKRHQRKLEELTNAFAQHDAQVAKSQRVQEGDNKARQESAAALRKQAQELVKARMEMLRTQSADLGKLLSMGRGALGSEQYDAVRNALRGVREEMRQIEGVMQRMDSYSTRSLFSIGRGTTPDYSPLVSSTKKLIAAKEQAAQASNQMTAAEQQLAQALNQTTQAAHGQSQVLSDLKSMATQYLGVWGGQQFLHNIIEIGGQLEMQRLSIGAILQNTSQANELFDKIKGLATQSPFGVVQLDQMTKQLTAYGFKYNELYDMTKRLADISAATGTDVSRLALALGHVRSEAALSGYTLRQFSMANVPLLQKLSEKLGKTTKEIREMTKKKEIGYDDVIGVLKDLTNEGGMFYNMQEVISESVKAKFKNVKDAMDIMYGEMAEGAPGEALKEVANVLMEVTRHWRDVATVMGTVAGVWAIHRAAILAMNAALGSNTASVATNMLAYKRKRAIELQNLALTRELKAEELELVATRKQITAANIRVALSTNAITKDEALRLVGLRKLSLEEAKALIRSGEFTAAEVRMAMEGRLLGFSLKRLGIDFEFAGIKFGKAGMMLKLFSVQAKAAMAALLTNPWTLAMAGASAVMELWQRNSREMEVAAELSTKIYERSQEALKNTRSMFEKTDIRVKWRENDTDSWSDVTSNYGGQISGHQSFVLPKFDTSKAQQSIEDWSQYIREYAATPNRILNEALFDTEGKVRSLEEQFNRLRRSVIDVAEAQRNLQFVNDAFENAVNSTNSDWLDDDIITNIADYDKTLKKFSASVSKFYHDYRVQVDNAIKVTRQQNKAFDEAVSGMGTYGEQFLYLMKHQDEYLGVLKELNNMDGAAGSEFKQLNSLGLSFAPSYDDVAHSKAEMMSDLESFYIQLEAELETKGIEIGSMSEAQQQALLLGYKDKLSSIQGLSAETANFLMKLFAERFQIQIDVNDEKFKAKVSETQRLLKELSDSEWNVDLNFASNVNDVIAEARKQYKAAKEFYENAEPVLIKFGVKMKMGDVLSEEKIKEILAKAPENARGFLEQVLKGANEASKLFNQSTTASKTGGFSLEESKKKKEKKDSKKTGGTKSYKDYVAEEWRERIRLLKEANKEYEDWNKRTGRDDALSRVQKQYGDIFSRWRKDKILPWKDFKPEDIVSISKYVRDIQDAAQKRYLAQRQNKATNNGKESLSVLNEAKKLLNELDKYDFDEKSKNYASNMKRYMDDMTHRWEIYKSVRETTGNEQMAARMAGFVDSDFDRGAVNGKISDFAFRQNEALKNHIDDILFQNGFGDAIDFNEVAKLSEEALDKYVKDFVKNNTPRIENESDESFVRRMELYKEKIAGIVDLLKEWQKGQKEIEKSGASEAAKILAASSQLLTQRNKILQEYEDTIRNAAEQRHLYREELKNNPYGNPHGLDAKQYRQIINYAENKKNVSLKELAADVKQFYNSVSSLSRKTARNIGQELLTAYQKAFAAGLFSADEYSKKVKSVIENMVKAGEQYNGSLYGRMARLGGWLFDRRNESNRSMVMSAAENVRYRIENEKIKGSNADYNLISVLERLEQALTNVAWGAGGRKEVKAAGVLGLLVSAWGSKTFGEQALAGIKAGKDKKEKEGSQKSTTDQLAEDLDKVTEKVLESFDKLQKGLDFVSEFFNAFGIEGAANAAADAADVLGSAMKGASALSALDIKELGPWGKIAGAGLGLISGLAQVHDKRLERQIEKLREDVQKIEANTKLIQQARERTLGFDTSELRRSYAQDYAANQTQSLKNFLTKYPSWKIFSINQGYSGKGQKSMSEYYSRNSSGTGYQQEYQNLLDQRKDYLEILDKQESKKKKSQSDIEETKSKIVELDDQIRYFTRDLAKELWDIDVKGWADQISDALASAFENGESMAKAYNDTVTSILQNVAKKMMQTAYLEKMFESLQNKLDDATKDLANDPAKKMAAVQSVIGEFFGKGGEGEQTITAAKEFMTAFQRGLEQNGLSLLNDSAKNLTSGVQGTSEETSDLLAGYVNALRQDVAIKRILLTQFVTELWPSYIEQVSQAIRALNNIDTNVAAIRALLSENGTIYLMIDSMRSHFDNITNGNEQVNIR